MTSIGDVFKRPWVPEEVFTPRSHAINDQMYIPRPNLERQVREAAKGAKHFCIYGESGNGKSWLWKQVFAKNRIQYTQVNLSQAAIKGSIVKAIEEKLNNASLEKLKERTVTSQGELGLPGTGVKGTKSNTFEPVQKDPVSRFLEEHKGNKRAPSVVVFENFEMIVEKPRILEELSNLIVLLDDEDFSKFHIRFCFVGVPSDLREYLAGQHNRSTIMNRLFEVDEVARMRPVQAKQVLETGLEKLLRLKFLEPERKEEIYQKLISVSDRIASELQEIGLQISLAAQRNDKTIEDLIVEDAILSWINKSHTAIRETIQQRLNANPTGRRSQCMYCLGICDEEDFSARKIREIFSREFPGSSARKKVDITGLLRQLSEGANPLIKKVPSGKKYRFTNPKFRMGIRAIIRKEGETVEMKRNHFF